MEYYHDNRDSTTTGYPVDDYLIIVNSLPMDDYMGSIMEKLEVLANDLIIQVSIARISEIDTKRQSGTCILEKVAIILKCKLGYCRGPPMWVILRYTFTNSVRAKIFSMYSLGPFCYKQSQIVAY